MILDRVRNVPRAPEDDLDETIDTLTTLLQEHSDLEMKRALTEFLIDFCDEWDEEQAFGERGWRHLVNLE